MEHVNDWCFHDIYQGGLWEDDLYACALILTFCTCLSVLFSNFCPVMPIFAAYGPP